jgi:hypothetical protein
MYDSNFSSHLLVTPNILLLLFQLMSICLKKFLPLIALKTFQLLKIIP